MSERRVCACVWGGVERGNSGGADERSQQLTSASCQDTSKFQQAPAVLLASACHLHVPACTPVPLPTPGLAVSCCLCHPPVPIALSFDRSIFMPVDGPESRS